MRRTAEDILFGSDGVNSPVKARIARCIGKSKSTISRWARDAGLIPLRYLRAIVRCRDLSDQEIIYLVRGR